MSDDEHLEPTLEKLIETVRANDSRRVSIAARAEEA